MTYIFDELEELCNLAYKGDAVKADYYMQKLIMKIKNSVTSSPKRSPCLRNNEDKDGYSVSCEEIMCEDCYNFYSSFSDEKELIDKDILNILTTIQTNNRPHI